MQSIADTAAPQRRRLALLLEYDGARYAGSQLQASALTVQSVLEDAIEKATTQRSRVAFAGRTDAGVHALGQVASFLTGSEFDHETMRRALNAWLPEDVSVLRAADVGPDFDPRRDAVRRRYRYLIDDGRARPAIDRGRTWHVAARLDAEAMADAAHSLEGCHGFAAFASRLENSEASTVRALHCFRVWRAGRRVSCEAEANAFLPHQVRRMVGALVEVGKGKLSTQEYRCLLNGPPASAGPAAPPHGLYLVSVVYKTNPFAADSAVAGLD